MAIYKIFPKADASIYSSMPAKNTGLDEILEVSVKNSSNPAQIDPLLTQPEYDDLRRSLIIFGNNDLNTVRNNITGSWTANLRLYLANAENLKEEYTIEVRQVSQSWTMGTGQFGDNPETRNGVCWYCTSSYYSGSISWISSDAYMTSGGGSWNGNLGTCSFSYESNKDLNCDVKNIVDSWFSGSTNNGFIVKHPSQIEKDPNSYVILNFFSVDTHTIYPPCLEFKWDDSVWITGSLVTIENNDVVVTVPNILETYKANTYYRFDINVRDRYPVRQFTTQSLYTSKKSLPRTSYWAIKDYKTEEMVIDFDTTYTKVSLDARGNFFNLNMKGLEPERSYKILIRTIFGSGDSMDIDNDLIFKITR